ncbi:DUF4157 domain-containing protein [Vicingaceae bacterium]|nr:DUF4157 domain-containing protein [Vicingaceae bacterium]
MSKEKENNSEKANRSNANQSNTQLKEDGAKSLSARFPPAQLKENNTGLPDDLKSGMENISGHSMDDVKVHRNSDKPAQLNAHAYAQGTDIHLAPGQEKHLPHELGHVVQQKEGRVNATKQMKGKVAINDDQGLEQEADVLGNKAMNAPAENIAQPKSKNNTSNLEPITQRNEVETPKVEEPKGDISSMSKEKDLSNSYEFNPTQGKDGEDKPIPFMGGVLKVKGNPTTGDGEFEYEHSLFQLSGSRKFNKDSNEYEYEGKGGPLPLKQEAKGRVPIAPIPLGIPGLFAEIAITAEASAAVVGNAGIRFKQDVNKNFMPGTLDFVAASVEAKLEAKCGIEGGVTAGVPGLAGVSVGGYGELGAELKGSLEIANYDDPNDPAGQWRMSGAIEGEAKGAAGVFARANALIWSITKKIPLAEGVFGKFEGKVEKQPLSPSGLFELAKIYKYCKFERNPAEKAKVEASAAEGSDKNPTEEPKKRGFFNRIFNR